jgi:HK97 family phage portal protein
VSLLSLLRGGRDAEQRISEFDIPWGRGATTTAAINEITSFNLSAVWACQTLIADSIATLPVDTYRKADDRREPTDPPRWVEHPNPETNRIDYDTQRMFSLLGWGNAYSLLTRRDGAVAETAPVVERWLLDPWRVSVQRSGGELEYRVDGVRVPTSQIQHVRGYTRPGCYEGMSLIEHARLSFGLSTNAETFGSQFFNNGVAASGVLEMEQMPAETEDAILDKIRDQVASRYAGAGNAGRPMILLGGTKWKQITINPQDAQFLETRKFQIEEICRWFRVPPHKVQQITDNASQGGGKGLETQNGEFAQDGLLPWVVRLEAADSALLPGKQFMRYNLNAYVRADIKTRHEVYQIRRNIGMANADELRALEDEQPIGGLAGESYWRPLNMGDAAVPAAADEPDDEVTQEFDDGSV